MLTIQNHWSLTGLNFRVDLIQNEIDFLRGYYNKSKHRQTPDTGMTLFYRNWPEMTHTWTFINENWNTLPLPFENWNCGFPIGLLISNCWFRSILCWFEFNINELCASICFTTDKAYGEGILVKVISLYKRSVAKYLRYYYNHIYHLQHSVIPVYK